MNRSMTCTIAILRDKLLPELLSVEFSAISQSTSA